jgi:hypothetical protein
LLALHRRHTRQRRSEHRHQSPRIPLREITFATGGKKAYRFVMASATSVVPIVGESPQTARSAAHIAVFASIGVTFGL